jgi:hypothetical protein
MSNILKKIGEFLRLQRPEQSAMTKMTEMEPMTEMKQQEPQSNDMAPNPGKMEMEQVQPEEH